MRVRLLALAVLASLAACNANPTAPAMRDTTKRIDARATVQQSTSAADTAVVSPPPATIVDDLNGLIR